jgi:hypothetical protein
MIFAGICNGNGTKNDLMCDVVVQAHASSISSTRVVSTHFSILVRVPTQLTNICVYSIPLRNSGHKSP